MRIGILTFHRAHNYGAVLQCYALIQYLKSLDNDVYIIDYSSQSIQSCYKLIKLHRIKSRNPFRVISKLIKEIQLYPIRKARAGKFDAFVDKHFQLLSPSSIDNLDIIIVGSDQVWNTKLTHGFNKYYWGAFSRNPKTRLISYAASIEEFWELEKNKEAIKLLSNFDSISVREEKAMIFLQELMPQKEISLCIDPTLIVPANTWNKIAEMPKTRERYLLVYQVRNSEKTVTIAQKIAKELSLPIVFLSASVTGNNSKVCKYSSPEQYLGLFKNASFIVCTSFHGTVFSLIFEKPFVSIKLNDGRDSRVETLLSKCNGLDHFISNYEEGVGCMEKYHSISIDDSIKFSSCQYLQNNLKNENNIHNSF